MAANLNGFNVLIADTSRMKPEDYAIQAGLQQDISWFNPFHEDNYYIAASILSWGGQVPATQTILRRAGNARTFDYLPLFHYGFNLYHFYNDPVRGAEALLAATPRASAVQDQWALQNIAAQWIERGYRLDEAAYRVEAMAKSAPPGNFRRYLAVRAARLRMLEELRKHALRYQHISGRKLESIDELVAAGIVAALPQDPLKVGFAIGPDGMPIFKNALRKNQP
ncbi:MAG TPA: hypothetical protein VJ001_09605 [Rhodocyclaceae bacterium]|nr:hypothetical protein [Rhodocyclaceae bacterium]